jgi:hypothetical protein
VNHVHEIRRFRFPPQGSFLHVVQFEQVCGQGKEHSASAVWSCVTTRASLIHITTYTIPILSSLMPVCEGRNENGRRRPHYSYALNLAAIRSLSPRMAQLRPRILTSIQWNTQLLLYLLSPIMSAFNIRNRHIQ